MLRDAMKVSFHWGFRGEALIGVSWNFDRLMNSRWIILRPLPGIEVVIDFRERHIP